MGYTQTYTNDPHYGRMFDDAGAREEIKELDRELKKGNWSQRFEKMEIKVARLEVEVGFIGTTVLGVVVMIALKLYGVT